MEIKELGLFTLQFDRNHDKISFVELGIRG